MLDHVLLISNVYHVLLTKNTLIVDIGRALLLQTQLA